MTNTSHSLFSLSNQQTERLKTSTLVCFCTPVHTRISVFFSSAVLILVLVLVTQVSHQNECDHTQVNHILNNWCQYCYSLVGLPNLNTSKRLLLL